MAGKSTTNVRFVRNSIEKVDLLERVETSFQLIVLAWNIDLSACTARFDTFYLTQQNLAG